MNKDNETIKEKDLTVKNDTKPIPDKPQNQRTFNKEQLLKSSLYKEKRDLINALLDSDKKYTKSEVNKIIEDYLKKVVE